MRIILLFLVGFLINSQLLAAQIIIGTSRYDPPFTIAADEKGHFNGFEIALMNGMCKRMHETCLYKALTFRQIFSQTLSGEVDLAMDAISITSDRESTFLFSLPYMASNARLLTNASSKINTMQDVVGKRIGVVAGTAFITRMQRKISNVKFVEYAAQTDLLQAVASHHVDLIVLDDAVAQYWVNNNGNLFKLVGEPIPIGIGYGIMANMNHSTLISRLNKALLEMESDGTYLALYKRYF